MDGYLKMAVVCEGGENVFLEAAWFMATAGLAAAAAAAGTAQAGPGSAGG